jgi:predicted metal-binding membrane protein
VGGGGFLGIWAAMMAAMMLPSTVPLLRLVEKVTPIGVAASLFISVALAAGALVWVL